ncbi:MAG: SsrA-binding protein SmpB [Pelagibacterales bacterium]|mgnify:FL=1|jgi:SsrA-binding protein|nr:SsrA-binding protein SmpB [Pelagibacterales bacterium]|tara:strand:+ start:321 stop:773 length:453 start_codon:yes stop_codon:yes gene_type:complete
MTSVLINKRAKREYEIIDTYEAGIILSGPEVKSLRLGRANIGDAYADPRDGEIWLINCHISDYFNAQKEFQFSPTRPRKLLLHKKEIRKLQGSVQKQGLTLIVLKIFFNKKGIAKIDLGLGRGKKDRDKRADEKNRDWQRQKQRLLRMKN